MPTPTTAAAAAVVCGFSRTQSAASAAVALAAAETAFAASAQVASVLLVLITYPPRTLYQRPAGSVGSYPPPSGDTTRLLSCDGFRNRSRGGIVIRAGGMAQKHRYRKITEYPHTKQGLYGFLTKFEGVLTKSLRNFIKIVREFLRLQGQWNQTVARGWCDGFEDSLRSYEIFGKFLP